MDTKDVEPGTKPGFVSLPSPAESIKHEDVGHPSVLTLLMVSMPRMAINAAWAAQWAAVGPWLSTMMPNWAVQLTQFVGPTVGIFIGPIIGALSDRCTHRTGRRRIWILFPAILSIVCWNLMGFTKKFGSQLGDYGDGTEGTPTNRKWTTMLMVFFYIWMDVTVNIVQIPAQLLVADLAGDRQTLGQAIGQGWSTLGALSIAVYIQIFGPAYETIHYFMILLSCLMGVSITVMCLFANEKQFVCSDGKSKWSEVTGAFLSVYECVRTMSRTLWTYFIIVFFVMYGFTAYNGGKGQFFGYEVFGGESAGADTCGDTCTPRQEKFNDGVQLATGLSDILFNVTGYCYSWMLPFLVPKFGLKWVLLCSLVPQILLIAMATIRVAIFDVIIVIMTALTQTALAAFMVPVCLYVAGEGKDVGMSLGALNSAICFGQLFNFALSSMVVSTSYGYALPVLIGGIMTAIAFVFGAFCFKVEIYRM